MKVARTSAKRRRSRTRRMSPRTARIRAAYLRGLGRQPRAQVGEHRHRVIDAHDVDAVARHRDGDAAVADAVLEHRAAGELGQLDVVGDVFDAAPRTSTCSKRGPRSARAIRLRARGPAPTDGEGGALGYCLGTVGPAGSTELATVQLLDVLLNGFVRRTVVVDLARGDLAQRRDGGLVLRRDERPRCPS